MKHGVLQIRVSCLRTQSRSDKIKLLYTSSFCAGTGEESNSLFLVKTHRAAVLKDKEPLLKGGQLTSSACEVSHQQQMEKHPPTVCLPSFCAPSSPDSLCKVLTNAHITDKMSRRSMYMNNSSSF